MPITKLSTLNINHKNDPYPYLVANDKDLKKVFDAFGQGATQVITLGNQTLTIINGLIQAPPPSGLAVVP